MKWIKLTLETTVEAEDVVSALLDGLGIEGVQIEDKVPISDEDKQRMFIDILPELPPDDGVAELSFYVDEGTDIDALKADIADALETAKEYVNVGSGLITVSETEDKDWINNWKAFFKPFRVDDGIVIKPTWETLTDSKE